MIGIYKITNRINNRCYIGQSVQIEKRWTNHKVASTNPNDSSYNYPLYQAFRKYGIDNFTFEVLEECGQEFLNDREEYWINYFDSYRNGYNQKNGGHSVSWQKISPEQLSIITKRLIQGDSQAKICEDYELDKTTVSQINTGKMWFREELTYPLQKSIYAEKTYYYCCDCGIEVFRGSVRCLKCENERRRKNSVVLQKFPTIKEQKELVSKILATSFCSVGREYGVTDNAVRKWLVSLGIPKTKKELLEWLNTH